MSAPAKLRPLNRQDYDAARNYAGRHQSDPFAYARALSRLAHGLATPDDLAEGVAL